MEVPEVAQQPDVGPVADAGQERIHQDDALDLGGILRRIRVGDHQADVVSDDPTRLKPSDAASAWMSCAMVFLS